MQKKKTILSLDPYSQRPMVQKATFWIRYTKYSEQESIGKEKCLLVSSRVGPWQGGAVRARSILLSAGPPSVIWCRASRSPPLSSPLFSQPALCSLINSVYHFSLEIKFVFCRQMGDKGCTHCCGGSQVQWVRQVLFQGHSCIERWRGRSS